jgi:hypothetical protein
LAALDNQSQTFGSTGNIINVTIANGAEFLGNRSIQPSNIIKAKVGDVIVFTNEDWQSHFFRSPPSTDSGGPQVAVDTNFHFWLFPGQSHTQIVSRPGGLHYELYGEDIKGAVIMEE